MWKTQNENADRRIDENENDENDEKVVVGSQMSVFSQSVAAAVIVGRPAAVRVTRNVYTSRRRCKTNTRGHPLDSKNKRSVFGQIKESPPSFDFREKL